MIPLGILATTAGGAAGGAAAYELISTSLADSQSSSVTFSSIPTTYKHLQIRFTAKSTSTGTASEFLRVRFNGDSTYNAYSYHWLKGNGSAMSSSKLFEQSEMITAAIPTSSGSWSSTTFGAGFIDILDYGSTTKNTTIRSLSGQLGAYTEVYSYSGFWNNTAAITSITLSLQTSGNLFSGSRISLYGLNG